MVFLSTDGVWAAVPAEAAKVEEGGPFKPLTELITKFMAAGGRVIACAPCCKKRNIDEGGLFEGVEVAGGAVLVEWLSNGSPNASYYSRINTNRAGIVPSAPNWNLLNDD